VSDKIREKIKKVKNNDIEICWRIMYSFNNFIEVSRIGISYREAQRVFVFGLVAFILI
jgi:hypothetical protein